MCAFYSIFFILKSLRSQYDGKILRKKITKTRVANFSRNFDDGSLSIRLSLSLITLLFKALSLK
ncbi:MAG: hypothetical protein ACI90V_006702 [Bacillariaceae sp.]|jgi:hypothetical protein